MGTTIFHNPRCSKSRRTLALLQERGIEPRVIEYLKQPPSKSRLKAILRLLDMKARELMRCDEAAYRENALDDESLTDDELISAMVKHPILIEQPIVLANGKAVIGRPPERILEIL